MAADLRLVAHAPSDTRTNLRSSAVAMDLASDVLPTPGGPAKHRMGPFTPVELADREVFEDAVFRLLEIRVVGVEHLLRCGEIDPLLGALFHGTATSQSR